MHKEQVVYLFVFYLIATILSYLFERKNRELFLKNEEVESKTKTIEQINRELKKENDIKDSLISILSHDVRGPLKTLESLLQLKESKLMSEEEILTHFEKLGLTVEKIRQFTERTILWIKSQLDGFSVTKEDIHIYDLIEETINLISEDASEKKISIDNQVTQDKVLKTDAEMFTIVIRNLLTNAIKFSNSNSQVVVKESKTYDSYRILVIDQGIGIKASKMASIFTLDDLVTEGTKKEKGTGLGLSLCFNLMHKLGGQLTVKSREGKGSTFTMIFRG